MPLCTILTKWPGTAWAAVQIAFFGGAARATASGCSCDIAGPRTQCLEDGIQVQHHLLRAADHQAVAALQSPDATTGAHVDIVDVPGRKVARATNVVDVMGIAPVDDNVAGLKVRNQFGQRLFHGCGRNHQPDGAGPRQFVQQVSQGGGSNGLLPGQGCDCVW